MRGVRLSAAGRRDHNGRHARRTVPGVVPAALESKGILPYVVQVRLYMSTLTITAKGQVTLRKDLLQHLGVHPGEKLTVDKLPDGRIEMKAVRSTGKIS